MLPPLYPPGSRVGAWLATHEWLRGLVARGHEVRVATTLAGAPPYVLDGVEVLPSTRKVGTAAWGDVVVAHAGHDARLDVLRRLDVGVPVVRIVHGLPVDPAVLAGAALVVANASATAVAVRTGGYTGPVEVVYPCTIGHPTDPGRHVTLVNLSAAKGGDLFWHVADRLPDLPFMGVRGGYGRQLGGTASNVKLVGPVQNMARDVYSRTRLLLMPSVHETWGMTAAEAMMSGIPVLARPTPGLVECLGAAGNFELSCDPNVWARRVVELLQRPAWHEASARALARAAQLDPEPQRTAFATAIERVLDPLAGQCVQSVATEQGP